ncbi:MAG: hypothetical protein JOZ69_03515 [Myxococcales bacterium]|nr:hypothetical protein [Myxococcales bacterium]
MEMLLQGISGEQPDRPKTMPQTDGQAAATYHVEHAVRAARTSPDEEPKVVVDRSSLGETFRIGPAVPPEPEAKTWMDAGPASPQPLVARVVVAVVAGLAVVAVIFVTLQRQSGRGLFGAALDPAHDGRSPWTAAVPVAHAAGAGVVAPPAPPLERVASAPAAASVDVGAPSEPGAGTPRSGTQPAAIEGSPAAKASPPAGSATSPASPGSPAKPVRTRPRPSGSATPVAAHPKGAELGEFKSSF